MSLIYLFPPVFLLCIITVFLVEILSECSEISPPQKKIYAHVFLKNGHILILSCDRSLQVFALIIKYFPYQLVYRFATFKIHKSFTTGLTIGLLSLDN